MTGLYIRVMRKQSSLKPFDAPNMPDEMRLYCDEALLLSAKAQTVVNMAHGRFADTVAPGPFKLRAFVEPRSFYGRIHGICNTYDLEGQYIDGNSVEATAGRGPADSARWLVHDTQALKPAAPGTILAHAWSAGCFVLSPSDLAALGDILDAYKVMPGDLIDGELVMVDG